MKSFFGKNAITPHQLVFVGIIVLLCVVPLSIAYSQTSINEKCQGDGECSSGGASNSTDGTACTVKNACGASNSGTMMSGVCQTKVYTGTDSKGNAQYAWKPLGAPALPAGYGNACNSTANACGQTNAGTINCSGVCSASTPALPANYGQSCTTSNACGASNSGTYQCNGSCSASAPALPSGYGSACQSAANACGQTNSGTVGCSGTCSASTPALPAGYGSACQSAANSCGMRNSGIIQCSGSCSAATPSNTLCAPDATITISATPQQVRLNGTARVTWSSTNANSCTVSGSNGDSWSGTSGVQTSSGLTDKTTYTVTCVGVNTKSASTTISVQISPIFHEI